MYLIVQGNEEEFVMWKKLLVACLAFIGLGIVVFASNSELFAQSVPQPLVYYGAGDTFERTNLNYFTMGGVNWRIVYANTGTTADGTLQPGEGYIMAADVASYEDGSMVYVFNCDNKSNAGELQGQYIDACMTKSQVAYTMNLSDPTKNDDMSFVFKKNNGLTTLNLMTLQDYNTITKVQGGIETSSAVDEFLKHEKNDIRGSGDTWLKDLDGTKRIIFWKGTSGYSTYSHLSSYTPNVNTISSVRPIFKVLLPQKGIIKAISYTPDPNVNLYANTIMTKPGAKLGDIDTDEGVGPYEFTIESGTTTDKDIDVTGNLIGAGKTLSTNFSLTQDSTNGTAELLVGNTPLGEGTYYVKVKVKDKVNNPRLYYDVDDPYREKSVVIKVVVTHDMKNISFTPNHHGITTTNITDLYTSTIGSNIGNVSELDEIGEAKVTGGVAPIIFDIISSSNSNDTSYQSFEIKTVNNVSKVVVKQGVNAQNYLDPGVYTFRIRAYDKNNDVADYTTPSNTKPINNSFQAVSNLKDQNGNTVTYGLVSEDITIVVYPSEHFITYLQEKDPTTNAYYKVSDLNTLPMQTKLGEISFVQASKLVELDQGGYSLRDVQLVKHNTTTEISELDAILPVGQIQDPYELEIRKKSSGVTFTASTITFDILVTFSHQGTGDVAQIRVENQKFVIPGSLQFYDSTGTAKNEFEVTFDPVIANNNKSVIYASDDTSATPQANAKVKYCILDTNGDCEMNSPTTIAEITPYNQLITGGSAGKISVEAKGPGTTEKEVTIRAMLMDSTGTVIQTYTDAVFKVKPAKQILTWEGDGVTQMSGSTDTWEVSLPWSGGTDTYDIDELLNSATRTNKLAIKNNIASGATTSIQYTLSISAGATDRQKVTVSSSSPYTLTITGEPQQAVYVVAKRAADGNYGESAEALLKLNINQWL